MKYLLKYFKLIENKNPKTNKAVKYDYSFDESEISEEEYLKIESNPDNNFHWSFNRSNNETTVSKQEKIDIDDFIVINYFDSKLSNYNDKPAIKSKKITSNYQDGKFISSYRVDDDYDVEYFVYEDGSYTFRYYKGK